MKKKKVRVEDLLLCICLNIRVRISLATCMKKLNWESRLYQRASAVLDSDVNWLRLIKQNERSQKQNILKG